MPSPINIFGRYGVIGRSALAGLKTAIVRGQTSHGFTPLGPTSGGGGLYGEFGLVGSEVITRIFQAPAVFSSRAFTRQAILGPTAGGGVTIESLLTLDWVQDAQPFVWYAAAPPSLMSLDWTQDAQPFATNDVDSVYLGKVTMRFVAQTQPLPANFVVKYGSATMAFQANATLGAPQTVLGAATMAFQANATINLDGSISGAATFGFQANSTLLPTHIQTGSATLAFQANSTFTGTFLANSAVTLGFQANASLTVNIVTTAKATMAFHATLGVPGAKRDVKPCEVPTIVLGLSSNLPYGLWQQNPDAIFTWYPEVTCDKTSTGHILVNGYYWRIDHVPASVPTYTDHFTQVSNAEIHLDASGYGAGDWWFHVSAVNWTGIGPASHYNVRYNHIPRQPGASGMFVDGFDSLLHDPLISYAPASPHVFSWTGSVDSDQSDTLVYGLQIAQTRGFAVNPSTGLTEILFGAESIPSTSYPLSRTLDPGQYYWRVRAFDNNQYSDWSPVAQFVVNHPPDAPFDLSVAKTG